jgi:hypothetical protein
MKYQVGDIVLLLHSGEEGEVVDIIGDGMVMINVGKVQFPVYADQIDFPYFKRFSEKKNTFQKKEKKFIDDLKKEKYPEEKRVEDGMWLNFLPLIDADEFGDDVVDELKVHLINRTGTPYNFDYKLAFFGKPEFEFKNIIHPFENFYLHDVPFEDLNDNPFFEFEFTLTKPDKTKAEICTASLKLKPKQLFTKIEEIRTKNEASFSYRLFEKYPDKINDDPFNISSGFNKYKTYDACTKKNFFQQFFIPCNCHVCKIKNSKPYPYCIYVE